MTLTDRIMSLDAREGRRYSRLTDTALSIATAGILRHFAACERTGVEPDGGVVREIIEDALEGRAVYEEKHDIGLVVGRRQR